MMVNECRFAFMLWMDDEFDRLPLRQGFECPEEPLFAMDPVETDEVGRCSEAGVQILAPDGPSERCQDMTDRRMMV